MKSKFVFIFLVLVLLACDSDDNVINSNQDNTSSLKILSLGDSYTIGESVCSNCKFPVQLRDSLNAVLNFDISLNVIAQTGWTTTSLLASIDNSNIADNNDLVTLLIGVNNQFQGLNFELYEQEFPELINKAILLGQNDKNNLLVLSIPDYAFTPFGQNNSNPENTSIEIDAYNAFAQNYCIANNITFINITDITRQGLEDVTLVASDGLHPSELAYTKFVERLLPLALEKIE